ncbi:MAG: biotin--[acetyl-CoA-carboxylase] ligase [Anaerostipes sp.]|uniref:biotin--[acetyl-CoA-carboxylase] ligase n=1 Tax=Anaerostipes sp. 992a TaxID=1261637 RepID=UPI000951B56B|nr:biotin--[acetyl-CoA-carboxylase] ligase [Anaerostipes sp. 992a]MCI5951515.1 biotin--[acetyl-CoA-carboxylase] ligase [Anaerostipes sp.]MDD5969563.1 biotin--[acetyl-CoA-carboxylase] ligase [Anaerostipes sp.]OLR62844.1 biotin--[acetyl-CoA-carboxylase] ligase [Anaerostipes sp. 992a]
MKTEILKALKNSDTYLSGEQLSQKFGVSRTAIWKYIKQLREEGYEIESVTRRGYRLLQTADRITASEILSRNQASWVGKSIEYFEVTDSTNQRIYDFAEKGREEGLLAVAEEQTGGKGRRGRSWVSPPGTGIWMSLLLRPKVEPQKASMVTIVAALAMTKAMEKITGMEIRIKWPNDVVLNGKKVCGILTEMSAELEEIHYIIVGIGINANTESFPEDIQDRATSIYLESGKKVERAAFIAEFCVQFEQYYERFLEMGNLAFLKEEYESYLINIGREVKIIKKKEERVRKALGINELGELIVAKSDGTTEIIFSGEVSVRGLYGYV